MVSPWMRGGTIVEFLRKNIRSNPLKLARGVFIFISLPIEPSDYSCMKLRAVFNIYIAWISSMAT